MKRWHLGLATTVLVLGLLASSPALAKHKKGGGGSGPPNPQLTLTPQVFLGSIFLAGDSINFSGSLTASSPTCTLTIATNSIDISEGVGPNGSLLFNGSNECPGLFELFLSDGPPEIGFDLPTSGGIGTNTGVYTGTFAIVSTTDPTVQGQTVVWAGNYTQVFNIDPTGMDCGNLTFCANLGPAFGDETFNGSGLSFLLELNGFTWSVTD
jgi:hypothetical protein